MFLVGQSDFPRTTTQRIHQAAFFFASASGGLLLRFGLGQYPHDVALFHD